MVKQPRMGLFARWIALLSAAFLSGVGLHLLWSSRGAEGASGPRTIVVHGSIALEEVFGSGIFPAFESEWARRTGMDVHFAGSFNPLGKVTESLLAGMPADLALLSAASGNQDLALAAVTLGVPFFSLPDEGVFARTPIVIVVRRGNPRDIRDFEDLARPGIGVVQPDPLLSGTAQWIIFAEYGSELRRKGHPHAALEMLLGIARNVAARAASPLEGRNLFLNGLGDALVTSEHEALRIAAGAEGPGHEVVYPRSTILSEPTVVAIERNIEPAERDVVEAFLRFLWEEEGQRIFVRFGFRSVIPGSMAIHPLAGRIEEPFSIRDLGGWKTARREIIDGIWRNRILKEVRR